MSSSVFAGSAEAGSAEERRKSAMSARVAALSISGLRAASARTTSHRLGDVRAILSLAQENCSALLGTQWQMKLIFELLPGSYMAESGWGKSGNKIIVNVDVEF